MLVRKPDFFIDTIVSNLLCAYSKYSTEYALIWLIEIVRKQGWYQPPYSGGWKNTTGKELYRSDRRLDGEAHNGVQDE